MSKIRINELARELEVKPNRILELLPEFGVEEKKTHSSSIDEDVAIAIKKKLGLAFDSDVALRAERDNYRAVALAEGPEDEAEESRDIPAPEVKPRPSPEPRRHHSRGKRGIGACSEACRRGSATLLQKPKRPSR